MGAAPLFGVGPSLGWIALALVICMSLAHTLASRWLRPAIESLVEARGHQVPRISDPSEERLVIVLVRIVPGTPFSIQNAILGLADVQLGRMLLFSVPIQMTYATGFVMLGQSAFEGRLGLGVLAIGLLGGATIVARLVYRRLRSHRDATGPAAEVQVPGSSGSAENAR